MLYLYRKVNTEYKKSCTKKVEREIFYVWPTFCFQMVDVQFNSKTIKLLEVFQSFSFLIFQLFFLYKIDEMISLAIFQETLNKCEKTKDDFLFI